MYVLKEILHVILGITLSPVLLACAFIQFIWKFIVGGWKAVSQESD